MKLSDLKIIVTGGAQGMGAHFARRLLEAGAQVAVGDVNEAAMQELPSAIHRRKLNVADEADVLAFVAWAHTQMGGLNGLINNAGILRDGLLVKKDKATGAVIKLPTAQWNAVLDVNLTGATFMVRETVAKMVETDQRPGVIINLSSVARHGNRGQSNYVSAKAALAANTVTWAREFAAFGIRVGAVAPGMIERKRGKIIHIASLMSELARPTVVPYTAAKGGVRQLTRGMAVELAPHGIQVNAIAPGYFSTEMNRALIDNVEFNAWVCKRTPAGRWGEPAELAGLAVFLASRAADYMTGQAPLIDGGLVFR